MTVTRGVPLLVPVEVEALVVNAADRRATRWSVSARGYAGASRLLPVEPPPFATGGDRPRLGVTLHWLLPDGLTVGRWHDADEGTAGPPELRYPFVPDRWMVVRTAQVDAEGPSERTRAWIVESNHVGADGTNPLPVGVAERLGRSYQLDTGSAGGALTTESGESPRSPGRAGSGVAVARRDHRRGSRQDRERRTARGRPRPRLRGDRRPGRRRPLAPRRPRRPRRARACDHLVLGRRVVRRPQPG